MRALLTTLLPVVVLAAMTPAASADSFTDTTPGLMAFAVPAGVYSLTVSATGGAGGDVVDSSSAVLVAGGRGALVSGTVAVLPGQQLQLTVPTSGTSGNVSLGSSGAAGAPDGAIGGYAAGGGGGATRVLSCQGVTCPVAVIAAGGGGAGTTGFVYVSASSVPPLPGGHGGDAGAARANGASDPNISGGSGGQPGSAASAGLGGAGSDPGLSGSGPAGGAGGDHSGAYTMHEGGGGGGGGVFGGGGGGSGGYGPDASLYDAHAGGGGGGGGSSLAPAGGLVGLADAHATPKIVLSWTPPADQSTTPPPPPPPAAPGPVTGQSGDAPAVVAAVSGTSLSPRRFRAAASGPSALAAKRRYGTTVRYTLNVAAGVRFTVARSQSGRRGGAGRCAKPTSANRRARACTRLVTVPGSFEHAGAAGVNALRFSGRLAGRRLKPGRYRLVATPPGGGSSASVAFQIVK